MFNIGAVRKLGKEDVLRAENGLSGDDGGAAHFRLPEGQIKDVVQSEGNQGAFDNAVNPGADVTGAEDQRAQRGNAGLHDGPDEEHHNADHQERRGGDNRHKAGAAEEREDLRKLRFIEPVVQRRHAKADHDTAEHAHLQRGDAQHGSSGVGGHGLHAAARGNHGGDGGVHDEIGNRAGEGRHVLFPFCHADGHAHGEQQSQVIEDRAAALVHDVQERINRAARIDDAGEVVGLQHGLVGEGTADAQQQSGDREQRYGQHKRTAHPLQDAKDLVFHFVSSLCEYE